MMRRDVKKDRPGACESTGGGSRKSGSLPPSPRFKNPAYGLTLPWGSLPHWLAYRGVDYWCLERPQQVDPGPVWCQWMGGELVVRE